MKEQNVHVFSFPAFLPLWYLELFILDSTPLLFLKYPTQLYLVFGLRTEKQELTVLRDLSSVWTVFI